jgi:type II secretory pathway component GspD/PulD (secretin)
MIQTLQKIGVVTLVIASAGLAQAQEKAAPKTAEVALKLQIVIARYENDKKISSMPYLVSVAPGRKATLRMGTAVPIASTTYTPAAAGGANTNPLTSYNYRDVGTNIDCSAVALDEGRFLIDLNIEDSSVEDQPRPNVAQLPSLRSFRASDSFVLKDGQTTQFTTAVDKLTGVVTKVDVTLTVVK